eukprot:s704_g13.t1
MGTRKRIDGTHQNVGVASGVPLQTTHDFLSEEQTFSQLVQSDAHSIQTAVPGETGNLWNVEDGAELDLSGLWTPSDLASGVGQDAVETPGYEPESACEETQLSAATVVSDDPSDFVGVNFDSCVNTALMSLPAIAPKPIWEEGVWRAIFGNGLLLRSDFCSVEIHKPPLINCLDDWVGQISACSRKLKRALPQTDSETYLEVVRHVTDLSWEEERESQLQTALKRWLMVVISLNQNTQVWQQLAAEPDDVAKLTVLSDLFRGRAPSTLLKKARAMEKLCAYFGIGMFPVKEVDIYRFFQFERNNGAPPSRLKSFLEALAFCLHVLNMEELRDAVNSRRLHGCTISSVPSTVSQASPLSVEELRRLHAVLFESSGWDAVFAGSALFVIYSRARWADAMHSASLLWDADADGNTWYVEAACATHKTMHAAMYKHRMLPLVAPALGVSAESWADRWFHVRKTMGVKLPPEHALMPAPAMDGSPSKRPLTATEAGAWMRKLLHGSVDHVDGKRITAHSMKSTMLSFAAKFGLSAETRLQLGYHTGGFKMVHTYSRDAAAQPLLELERLLTAVREGSFLPDSTRSGRFVRVDHLHESGPGQESAVASKRPEPAVETLGVEVLDTALGGPYIDLTEVKLEEPGTDVEAPSSSSDESAEEFPTSQSRVFTPPTPPSGYVFWQHRKLRTLHLAPPDYNRVFMCNRDVTRSDGAHARRLAFNVPSASVQNKSLEEARMSCASQINGIISSVLAVSQYVSDSVYTCPAPQNVKSEYQAKCSMSISVLTSGVEKSAAALSDIAVECRDPTTGDVPYSKAVKPGREDILLAACLNNIGQALSYIGKIGYQLNDLATAPGVCPEYPTTYERYVCTENIGSLLADLGQVATYLSAAASGCGDTTLVPFSCSSRIAATVTGMFDAVQGIGGALAWCNHPGPIQRKIAHKVSEIQEQLHNKLYSHTIPLPLHPPP